MLSKIDFTRHSEDLTVCLSICVYNVHSVYVDCGCLYVCTLYVSASTSVTSLKSFLGMLPLLPFFLWNFIWFVLKRNRAVPIPIIDKMQALRLIENSMVKRLNLSNTWSGEEQYQSVQFTSVSQLRLFAKGTTPFRFAAYFLPRTAEKYGVEICQTLRHDNTNFLAKKWLSVAECAYNHLHRRHEWSCLFR